MNLLIGNPNIGLQPKCGTGSGCQDCLGNLCCYTSRFSYGHVLIGSLKDQHGVNANNVSSIRQIALCKIFPALKGAFFQGEAIGASPVKRCSSCKNHLKNCRFCSEDRAPLTAVQEEEYKSLKLHCQFDSDQGSLVAKYPGPARRGKSASSSSLGPMPSMWSSSKICLLVESFQPYLRRS